MRMRLLKHSTYLLPLRPYDISELSDFGKRKRVVKPKEEEEVQIENSDELRSLPESETQDEKMSEATTSTPPLSKSSVHEQSIRIAALALEKKRNLIKTKNKKIKPALKALLAMERKSST
ncbi:hypothetical protein HA466_0292940 [Hirschfeldia incana]|nr:hypothetical protein HA466_0292940 [Hirschfeldia incana]